MNAGNSWKSKIDWRVIREIDLNLMPGEEERIPELGSELNARLAQRAQQAGYLERAPPVYAPDAGDEV